MEAFFFPTTANLRLLGVWRGPENAARCWILCPPFAEEEKSARRVLTQIAQLIERRGEASLLFSWRGSGDSEGDFADASLSAWRQDLAAACHEAQKRAPAASIALLGVRLGGSLALQSVAELGAKELVLIEPLLAGRSFLMQQNAKKQIRAKLTGESEAVPAAPADSAINDLDGWALGAAMKAELSALDLRHDTPTFSGTTHVFQVGPRPEVAPPLAGFAETLGATAQAVVMPPFWNLIDYADPGPLLRSLESEVWIG